MKTLALTFSIFALLTCIACAGDKKEKELETATPPATPQQALEQAQKAIQDANLKQPVEPVNFRKLQELMPESIAGFTRTNLGGETTGALNMKFSKAEGRYKSDDGKNLRIDIVDTGGLGFGLASAAAWSTVTIDKEDENGYERSGTLGGNKSFEKFRKSGSDCEVAVVAENRFVVTANCRGCDMETVRAAVQGLDLAKLKTF